MGKKTIENVVNQEKDTVHNEEHKINVSRRKLLASMGLTGAAAVVSGGLVSSFGTTAFATEKKKKKGPITDDADRISYYYTENQIQRTVGEKFREAASVMDFGAKGDGETDDTQSISSALTMTKTIIIPEGYTFVVNDLELIDDVTVLGTGTLKKTSKGESALHVKGENIVIDSVRFASDDNNGQPSTEIKLGDGSGNIRITSCLFTGSVYSAISGAVESSLEGGYYENPVDSVIITNCVFDGYNRPNFLHSVNNITIATNIFRNCQFDAIRLRENDGHCIINAN